MEKLENTLPRIQDCLQRQTEPNIIFSQHDEHHRISLCIPNFKLWSIVEVLEYFFKTTTPKQTVGQSVCQWGPNILNINRFWSFRILNTENVKCTLMQLNNQPVWHIQIFLKHLWNRNWFIHNWLTWKECLYYWARHLKFPLPLRWIHAGWRKTPFRWILLNVEGKGLQRENLLSVWQKKRKGEGENL